MLPELVHAWQAPVAGGLSLLVEPASLLRSCWPCSYFRLVEIWHVRRRAVINTGSWLVSAVGWWASDLVVLAGGENAVEQAGDPPTHLSWEQVSVTAGPPGMAQGKPTVSSRLTGRSCELMAIGD